MMDVRSRGHLGERERSDEEWSTHALMVNCEVSMWTRPLKVRYFAKEQNLV